MSKTILREFRTDVLKKEYTKCPRNIIIASDFCKGCRFFKELICDDIKDPDTNTFIHRGIVECSNINNERR